MLQKSCFQFTDALYRLTYKSVIYCCYTIKTPINLDNPRYFCTFSFVRSEKCGPHPYYDHIMLNRHIFPHFIRCRPTNSRRILIYCPWQSQKFRYINQSPIAHYSAVFSYFPSNLLYNNYL